MMIKEPIGVESELLPTFESTLVVAFPDVLMAGPKILLSSPAAPHADSIPAWSHFCTTPAPTHKKSITIGTKKKRAVEGNAIRYSTVSGGIGLLTIAVAPPTNEQSTYLSEAIVNQARVSGTQQIVLVAASNFASKVQDTHIVQLHQGNRFSSSLQKCHMFVLSFITALEKMKWRQ